MQQFHNVIRRSGIRPERALEVGGVMGDKSLLRFPELDGAERFCLNLVDMPSEDVITAVTGNANDMRACSRTTRSTSCCAAPRSSTTSTSGSPSPR